MVNNDDDDENEQRPGDGQRGLALSDTHIFLLNEYFIEFNRANFNILIFFKLNFVERFKK